MTSSEIQIANLLYRYAELTDGGDVAAAADLFRYARINMAGFDGDATAGYLDLLESFQRFIIMYPDGTPRTKCVISNPIIEVDEDSGTASCRSYYTVFQQTDGFPLQPIVAGRYHDRFERVDGLWRYSYRHYLVDFVGDMSRHGAEVLTESR